MLLILVLVVSACATTPTVPPTMKSVAGTYERKEGGDTVRLVLLDNGVLESYKNGNRNGRKTDEVKWKIVDGELHLMYKDGTILAFRINKDGSLTPIAKILKDGKRKEILKENK